jgi:REP element-mobilizing transposase RayT
MKRVEQWLDQGLGSCQLKDPALARFIRETMHHFDGIRYELGCYVVMPNHVHLVIRPTRGDADALEKILQSWKRYSAQKINCVLGVNGPFWQEESYDRIIRDEDHLARAIQYVGDNPTKAGLAEGQFHQWIRPEWEQAGWTFPS